MTRCVPERVESPVGVKGFPRNAVQEPWISWILPQTTIHLPLDIDLPNCGSSVRKFYCLAAVVYRVTTGSIHSGRVGFPIFAPLAAIALCSAAYFPKKYKFTVPLLTLFISDVIINFRYGAPLLDPQILSGM